MAPTDAPGVWYERFARDVYQALVNQDAVRNVTVEHNVTLVGRSGATHQIDVFWEFELAGTRYRTCVECKAYSSSVKKTQIAAFATILQDIGNATGIFVTTEGYQSGAQKLAEDRHIRLIVLNPVIRAVGMEMQLLWPEYTNVDIRLDHEACKPILQAAGRTSFSYSRQGSGDSIVFVDASGDRRCTLNEFVRGRSTTDGHHSASLTGYFFDSEIGPLPLHSIQYDLTTHEIRESILVEAEDAVKAVIEDVLQNTCMYVHEDGSVAPKETT